MYIKVNLVFIYEILRNMDVRNFLNIYFLFSLSFCGDKNL